MNILFVCTANVSRSFMAETLFRHVIDQQKIKDVSVSSVGVSACPGSPPDPEMVDYLLKRDITVTNHVARQMQQADVVWADRIFVMEKDHAEQIQNLWPDADEKTELLGKYIATDSSIDDIVDPYGRSPYHYRLAQSQISLAIQNIVKTFWSNFKADVGFKQI